MKGNWKRLVAGFLCGVVICTGIGSKQAVHAEAAEENPLICSGNCGENVQYYLHSDGWFRLMGSGEMDSYENSEEQPWKEYRNSIKKISMESSVTNIGAYAFAYCYELESVSIPSGVTSIGEYAFYSSGLSKVYVPSSVTNIGSHAFGSGRITSAGPAGKEYAYEFEWKETIPANAFMGCGLESVEIPSSVTSIEAWAFFCCEGLTSVNIPSSVISIGDYAFSGCSGLTSINIPSSVTSIGELVFSECSSLASVEISQGVTSIGSGAFMRCGGLTNVRIPSSVTSIGAFAFQDCDSLISAGPIGGSYNYEFEWEDVIPAHAFDGCSSLTSMCVPSSVTSIGDSAFKNCNGLTRVDIPSGVTHIGAHAFSGCSGLKGSVDIPLGVSSIECEVFYGCNGLSSIRVLNPACKIFDGNGTIPEGAVIYGYAGSTAQAYAEKYKRTFVVLDPVQDTAVVSLEAVKSRTEYTVGDVLNTDDLTVTAHYADGSTKTVTGFTTDASGLDMSAAGTKILTVTYEENGVSVKTTIEIVVKEKKPDTPDTPDPPDDPVQTTYTVTFDLQGKGKPLEEYAGYSSIVSGSTIKEPASPEEEGYRFTGWYKDAGCTVQWDFAKDVVLENTVLYAGWEAIPDDADKDDGILPGDKPADGKIPEGIWIAGVEECTYTGAAVTPQVRVYHHDKRLMKGRDYTVSYKNNKKAALSSERKAPMVIVKGVGNYTGTVSEKFTIEKAVLTDDCLEADSNYFAGSAYAPVVMLDENILKARTDYTLTYYQDGQEKKLKKQPTAEGSYSMQVVGKGSCEGKIIFPYKIVKGGRISIAKGKAVVPNITCGSSEPAVSLKVAGGILKNGTDYTVRFINTERKGTAAAIFTGTGKYTDVLKKTFKVKAAPLPKNCISVVASAAYEKGGAKPEVTITVNGAKLAEGIDYTAVYTKNTRPGSEAKVTVKGKGNYSGSQYASFKVTKKDLALKGVQVYVSDAAASKKPAVLVYDTNGKKLSLGSDYDVKTDTASHQVTVTGGKNELYTASTPIIREYRELEKDKVITSVSLNKNAVGFPTKFQYTNTGVQLDKSWLTVKAGKNVLPAENFDVVGYVNHTSKGTATVIVQGTGEYGGIKALNFKIQPQSIVSIFQ